MTKTINIRSTRNPGIVHKLHFKEVLDDVYMFVLSTPFNFRYSVDSVTGDILWIDLADGPMIPAQGYKVMVDNEEYESIGVFFKEPEMIFKFKKL